MTIWRPERARLQRPIYHSLVKEIRRAVEDGELVPNTRLPTHRRLAEDLGISVQTVSRAYEELVRLGLLTAKVGCGTFVAPTPEDRSPRHVFDHRPGELIDLSLQKPVLGEKHHTLMAKALGELSRALPDTSLMSFRPNRALASHRATAVDWLIRCGVTTTPDRVHITNGATHALMVALMTATRPGETVATEYLAHHTLVPLARYLGIRLKGLSIDDEGIIPEALEEACAAEAISALFILPTCAGPSAGLMGGQRRHRLAEIASRHDVMIIENEAWGPLTGVTLPPFAAIATERTLYVTSFTKCVMPGLRVGYLVVPSHLSQAVSNRNLVTSWMATPLIADIASRWIEDGTAWELMEWQRAALERRNAIVARRLEGVSYRGHKRGLHVWLWLPENWKEDEFVSHARIQGVAVAPGNVFRLPTAAQTAGGIRIAVGTANDADLDAGLSTVARLYQAAPEPVLLGY